MDMKKFLTAILLALSLVISCAVNAQYENAQGQSTTQMQPASQPLTSSGSSVGLYKKNYMPQSGGSPVSLTQKQISHLNQLLAKNDPTEQVKSVTSFDKYWFVARDPNKYKTTTACPFDATLRCVHLKRSLYKSYYLTTTKGNYYWVSGKELQL